MSAWLRFTDVGASASGKTRIWAVGTRDGQTLGEVRWWAAWRRYTFFPNPDTIYESGCLRDLADFCRDRTKWHRAVGSPANVRPLSPESERSATTDAAPKETR